MAKQKKHKVSYPSGFITDLAKKTNMTVDVVRFQLEKSKSPKVEVLKAAKQLYEERQKLDEFRSQLMQKVAI